MGKSGEFVCVGALAGAWGVQGAVRLKSFCAVSEAIADYAPLQTEDGRSFGVTLLRPLSGAFAARLSGIADRETAEALKGTRLYAPRDRLPALPDDEFYYADLIGLTVLDTGGAEIGRMKAVMDHGAGDVLEIERRGKPPLLLPFTREIVPTVDLEGGRVIVDLPPGIEDGDDD